jgi:hypothetical protein
MNKLGKADTGFTETLPHTVSPAPGDDGSSGLQPFRTTQFLVRGPCESTSTDKAKEALRRLGEHVVTVYLDEEQAYARCGARAFQVVEADLARTAKQLQYRRLPGAIICEHMGHLIE